MCACGRHAERSMVRSVHVVALFAMLIASAAEAKTCAPIEVRVMSYNIRLDVASDGPNAWPYRRNELIGQIEIVRPDIFGLQEVVPGQRRDIAAALNGYALVGVARDDGRDSGEYSPLGINRSTFAINSGGTFWLSPTPDRPSLGWDAGYKRIATWARLKHRASGTSILAINTHWDNQGRTARRESGALIARWVAAHRRAGDRLLLIGDFNAPLTEESMRLLAGSGLADTRALSSSPRLGPLGTFNDFQPIPVSSEAIDHILVGKQWKVRRHAVIAQNVEGRMISDHFPVVADLETKPARCSR
jgi:endonuclease/exonuclease/phosphatase family metal-dependent hydrolase